MPGATITLALEAPRDHAAVEALTDAAFGTPGEARLISALRGDPGAISLVAAESGVIVGHILFSVIDVEGTRAMALAPMAVRPDRQGQGIGTALVQGGLQACRDAGHRLVIVLGHPEYYPRFGFIPAQPLGILSPWPVGDAYFMVLALVPGALEGVAGTVVYPPAFAEV